MARTRIVVVGGGVAGLELASRLARRGKIRRSATVTLVDRGLSHFWKPILHTYASGTGRSERHKVDFLGQAKACGFHFWPGLLTGVDRAAREVILAPDVAETPDLDPNAVSRLSYDILVLAIGGRSNSFGTPGVEEHCLTIDDLAGADRFRRLLRRELFGSSVIGRDLTIAIVGGGPTGIELAAELKRALDLIEAYGEPGLRPSLKLSIIEHGPRLLATFPEVISAAATTLLSNLGVNVRTATGVVGADADGFLLADGSRVDASIKVWAAGVKAPDVLATIDGLETSRSGQIVVDDTLQSADPAIYAMGDCAFFTKAQGGRGLPGTAQVAHQQARHLARHLDPALSADLPPFVYRDLGSLVDLGGYDGWGTIGGRSFGGGSIQGLVAKLGHDLLYRQHQFVLLGPVRATAAILVDGLDKLVTPAVRLDT